MAVSPEKDLELFAGMAARGQRLSGISAPGLWLFEPAEPEQAVFAVDYTDRADEDYLALFEAAGWHRVLGVANMQIFKAAPGTRPADPAAPDHPRRTRGDSSGPSRPIPAPHRPQRPLTSHPGDALGRLRNNPLDEEDPPEQTVTTTFTPHAFKTTSE